MDTCDAENCTAMVIDIVKTPEGLSLKLCEWHKYEFEQEIEWLGKEEQEAVKYTIPKIKIEE